MLRRSLIFGSVAVTVVAILPGSPGLAATADNQVPLPLAAVALTAQPDSRMLSAMQRDMGLSAGEAVRRLGREQAAHGIDSRVRRLAGSGYAGTWLEDNATVLRVGVTRRGLMSRARAAGATPVLMRHSLSELDAASRRLGSVPFPSRSLTGWRVDLPTNRVVIGHLPGGRAAAEEGSCP